MYKALIERLREEADCPDNYPEDSCLMRESADAIENLCAKQHPMKVTEIHVDEYYCPSCGAENNCDQGKVQDTYCPACGQRLWAEPPMEEI